MTPQRITYVLNIFPKISETFIAEELAELRRRGVQLRILSLQPPRAEPQHELIKQAGLDTLVKYDVGSFAARIAEFQPELIHAHFAREATAQAWELSQRSGIPFCFTAHGYDIHRKPPPDFLARALAARAVVTVSQANQNYLVAHFGVPRHHIRVIPCGVDTRRFCPESPGDRRGSLPPGGATLLCVARQVAVKNLGLLLAAAAELRRRQWNFQCVMIGDGALHGELQAKREQLGLAAVVAMPGAMTQEEVRRWWQRADVGVLCSENEGMPVCLMEAAACGVPVVATGVGGIPELVEHGVTGMLTPPGDPGALADALEALLGDADLRRRMGMAARERALKLFSVTRQVDALLAMWGDLLAKPAEALPFLAPLPDARVSDPLGAARDAALPALAVALDFGTAWSAFKRRLPRLSGPEGKLRLKSIRVTRHKPGKRAVVEFEVKLRRPNAEDAKITLIGKTRAGRSGNEAYRLQDAIWEAGFQSTSADGISVPEPVGVIADFRMWFQHKVAGVTAEEFFATRTEAQSTALARRVAEAIHKLHRAGVPTDKQHLLADELRILHQCFAQVEAAKPAWTERLRKLQRACEDLGASLGTPRLCGIHRDFYSAQVIVEGARLWLIDFDLYCLGDPGLDVGNFLGHITEQALRERGDARAFAPLERALEDRFVELGGESMRPSVQAYANLTLARHVFLSTRFPERGRLTESLLELLEQRLS